MRELSKQMAAAAEVVEEWTRTTVQAGHLLPSNPELLAAAHRLQSRLRHAVEAGVHWLHLWQPAGSAPWLVGGATEEPVELEALFQSEIRHIVQERFVRFLEKEGIVSVAVHTGATAGDVNAWIEAVGLRWRLLEEREAASTATPAPDAASLGAALDAAGTWRFSVVSQAEVAPLPQPWSSDGTLRIAVTRLCRWPRAVESDEASRHYAEAFALRCVPHAAWPGLLAALAAVDAQALRRTVAALPEPFRVAIGWELVAKLASSDAAGDEANDPTARESAAAALRAIVGAVDVLRNPRARALAELAWRHQIIDFDDIAEEARVHLRAHLWAEQFVRDPLRFVARLHDFDDAKALATYLDALVHVYRVLVERAQFGPALVLLRAVRALARDPATTARGLAEVARQACERIERVPTGNAILALLRQPDDANRAPILAFLREVGTPAVAGLVHALRQAPDARLRDEILATLRAMGPPAAESLARIVHRSDVPAELAVSIVRVLGEVGGDRAAHALLTALRHRDQRIASAALDAVLRALPPPQWTRIVRLWPGLAQDVRIAALRRFAASNWRDPALTRQLVAWLDRYARGEETSDREALAILHYLGAVEPDGDLTDGVRAVCQRIAQPGLLETLRRPVRRIVPPRPVREAAASVLAAWTGR